MHKSHPVDAQVGCHRRFTCGADQKYPLGRNLLLGTDSYARAEGWGCAFPIMEVLTAPTPLWATGVAMLIALTIALIANCMMARTWQRRNTLGIPAYPPRVLMDPIDIQ